MQTAKSQKSNRPAAQKRPHCFPDLHKINPRQASDGDACAPFQPLFEHTGGSDGRMTACTFDNQDDADAADGREAEQKRCYRRGFEAGQAEACKLVQSDLAPRVIRFEQTLDAIAKDVHQLATASGEAIKALALAIAEKILHEPAGAARIAGQDLQHRLSSALASAYTLELVLNQDDYDMLNGLMDGRDLNDWQDTPLPIGCSEDVQRGGARQQSQQLPMSAEQVNEIVGQTLSAA